MSTQYLTPLAMSQTKEELLRYLNMGLDTYSLMAKEADRVYMDLISDKRHLKKNCKRKPPYDWSDIVERSKDDAMRTIARSGTPHTAYHWNLAADTTECPNWIARWFLYHKFRYRDGRNRNPTRDDGGHSYHSGSRHNHHNHGEGGQSYGSYCESSSYSGSATYGQTHQEHRAIPAGTLASMNSYSSYDNTEAYEALPDGYRYPGQEGGSGTGSLPYDPVRDAH